MRSPKPRRRSYYGGPYGDDYSYAPDSGSYATTTTPTSIPIPAPIKTILDQISGFIPDNIIAGVPTEYILIGAGIAITLLPLGKFKAIANLGGYAALGLGAVKLANPYFTAQSAYARTTDVQEEFYYSTITGGGGPGK